jgi:hypothetical protein
MIPADEAFFCLHSARFSKYFLEACKKRTVSRISLVRDGFLSLLNPPLLDGGGDCCAGELAS